MKIARIKEILNIGTFTTFSNGASIGFEKLTFISGLNTFGKTTLSDIFQSLKLNNPSIINSRKSIPPQSTQQKVVITQKNTSESDFAFTGVWASNQLNSNLEVFGTDFIHRNLFTGLTIERDNRENFTQFVLGEKGVKLAGEIASKRKLLGDKKRILHTIVPKFVSGKVDAEVQKFLAFSIKGINQARLNEELLQANLDFKNESLRLKTPQKILSIQEPEEYTDPELILISNFESINSLLQKDYSEIKDNILREITSHLSENFSDQNGAERWINDGMHYCKDGGKCPFCGQILENSKKLIETYHSYFNPAYSDFITEILAGISSNLAEIESAYFTQTTILQPYITAANLYKELIRKQEFQDNLNNLNEKYTSLNESRINSLKIKLLKELKNSIDEKKKSPHKKIKTIDLQSLSKEISDYKTNLTDIKNLISVLKKDIKSFKKPYNDTTKLRTKISDLSTTIENLNYKIARIDQNNDCVSYIKAQDEIKVLEGEIIDLQDKLKSNQSKYLDEYFTEIDDLFKKLGSKNFKLEMLTDNTGHMPVYSLKVKFKNVDISNSQLNCVFSESDRRALALSVFWAKINLRDESEKSNTIVILDDPITSFDDNRITITINLFKESLDKVSQMIILTHYTHFIRRFCEITKQSQITTKFIKISQNSTTSYLENAGREEFSENDYSKMFDKIYGYINKKHNNSIKSDLRPFFENLYLPTVYAKQITDKNVDCSSLENMIDGIFDDDTIKAKLHSFRTTLNPDSHLITSNNDEDVRNFASEMIDYLFSIRI